jgi:hypothetical protein
MKDASRSLGIRHHSARDKEVPDNKHPEYRVSFVHDILGCAYQVPPMLVLTIVDLM